MLRLAASLRIGDLKMRVARNPANISRRRFSLGAAAVISASGTARAAEVRWRLGTNQPDGSPMHLRLKEMAERVRFESEGKILLDVSANGQRREDFELYMMGNALGSLVPVTEMPGLPFTFRNSADVFAALDGELGDYIRAELAAKGIHAFRRQFENGFHHITTSTRPINAADDFVDLKIRTPPQKMPVDFFTTLGAKPSVFTFDQLHSVLKDRTVDGQTDPLIVVEVLKLHEVQTYLSLTNHWWSGFTLIADSATWNGLPGDLKDIVERNADAAALRQRADVARVNAAAVDSLRRKGMVVNEPDTAGMRRQLPAFYARWKANYGTSAWSLLERQVGKLV